MEERKIGSKRTRYMHILHISNVSSGKTYKKLFNEAPVKPATVSQKYYSLLLQGLSTHMGVRISVISSRLVNRKSLKHLYYDTFTEKENGIEYFYLPFINILLIRQIYLIFTSFINTIRWSRSHNSGIIMWNILDTPIAIGVFIASRIVKNKTMGIVTDLPAFSFGTTKKCLSMKQKIQIYIEKFILSRFDSYIFLTEAMDKLINTHNRPYVIIEGQVDSNIIDRESVDETRGRSKICMYTGGIKEIYGLDMLINAFADSDMKDYELQLYGTGDYVDHIDNAIKHISNIKYMGMVDNSIIIQKQKDAILLINPRPSKSEYTKYSFPSKILEYMVSGTAVLTTKLPGIPKQYWEYLYTFEDETEDGLKSALRRILSKPESELLKKGKNAREFVISNKNSKIQTGKIIEMIEKYSDV